MAFERVVASRTPPTAEESVVVKVVEPQKRETIKRTERKIFKDPLPTPILQKGKKGVLTIRERERKKERKKTPNKP